VPTELDPGCIDPASVSHLRFIFAIISKDISNSLILAAPNDTSLNMGMPLPSLHSPSVASNNNATSSDATSIQDLIRQKDSLEGELKALGEVLDSVSLVSLATFFPLHEPDVHCQTWVTANVGGRAMDVYYSRLLQHLFPHPGLLRLLQHLIPPSPRNDLQDDRWRNLF